VVAHAALLGKSGERDTEAMAKIEDLAQIDPTFYEQYQRVTLFYPDPPTELLALAQKTFERIHTATHGTDARSSTALGIVAFLSGNRAAASVHITRALGEVPPDAAAFVFAGLLAESKGDKRNLDAALAQLTEAKSQVPSAFLSTAIGRVEIQRGNYQKAMSDLQDALNRDPEYSPAHYWLGVAYQKKGDSRQAVDKWAAALKHDPNFVRASRAMFDIDRPAT
jgi:tetratricopeptide (TPR) repeat protein